MKSPRVKNPVTTNWYGELKQRWSFQNKLREQLKKPGAAVTCSTHQYQIKGLTNLSINGSKIRVNRSLPVSEKHFSVEQSDFCRRSAKSGVTGPMIWLNSG